MISEGIKVKGSVGVRLIDKEGKIKREIKKENLIVNVGRDGIADQLLSSPTINKPSHMQLGEGDSSPALGDVDLDTPIGSRTSVGASRS